MLKLNIGEWSEGYVFLKLLGEGKVYARKSNENAIDPNVYLNVLAVICRELNDFIRYSHENTVVRCILGDYCFAEISAAVFLEKANSLFEAMKGKSDRTIEVPEIEAFFTEIKHYSIKGTSKEFPEHPAFGGKTDIVLEVQSNSSGIHEEIGFSIKSYAGSPPTLFNTAASSCMLYEIKGISDEEVRELNAITAASGHPDVLRRVAYIKERGLELEYKTSYISKPKGNNFGGEEGPLFAWNLELLDSQMPKLISEMLLVRYGYKGNVAGNSCIDAVSELVRINPLNVRNPEVYYPTKIKNFVYASFGKMTASTEWDGTYKINGGYIEVTRNGEVFFIRANSDDQFMTYLITHTKIESPSTNPQKKHHHGEIIRDDETGKYYLGLNFQIRFNSAN